MKDIMKSIYGVFIIESLRGDDFFDGEILSEILDLSQINNIYREVESIEDFQSAIVDFKKSGLRYLHLSCHADMDGIEINGEEVSNHELSEMFYGNLEGRRVFLSACKGGNRNMATAAITRCSAQSVIGTPIDLYFDKAALFWPSFYHVINCVDNSKMNKSSLASTLKKCVDLFEIPINYYHSINEQPNYLRRYKFKHGQRTTNTKIRCTKVL